MKYVVAHYTRGLVDRGPQETKQYLWAINHNPYNRPNSELRTHYVSDASDAFKFTEKSAAEFAACFIGGDVEEYKE